MDQDWTKHNWNIRGATQKFGKYMPKGTTSKEKVETRGYDDKLFYGQIPWIFG
jgi:hypothetical protein